MPRLGLPPGTPFGPDWQLKALIARGRYENGVTNDVARLLADFYVTLQDRIASGVDLTDWQRDQLLPLRQWAKTRLDEIIPLAQQRTIDGLTGLGNAQLAGQFGQAQALRTLMGVPSRAQLIQTARFREIIQAADIGGETLGAWWQRDAVSTLVRMQRTVQQQLLLGENPRAIARLVISRDPAVVTLERVSRTSVRAAIRTAATAVSSAADRMSADEMRDVVDRLRFTAILDARTSILCGSLDGREYRVGDPKIPWPPVHVNCRSSVEPIPDLSALGLSEADLGERVTHDQWLRAQSHDTQHDILGKDRAAWFRDGHTLSDFVSQDRKVYTLQQLRDRLTQ